MYYIVKYVLRLEVSFFVDLFYHHQAVFCALILFLVNLIAGLIPSLTGSKESGLDNFYYLFGQRLSCSKFRIDNRSQFLLDNFYRNNLSKCQIFRYFVCGGFIAISALQLWPQIGLSFRALPAVRELVASGVGLGDKIYRHKPLLANSESLFLASVVCVVFCGLFAIESIIEWSVRNRWILTSYQTEKLKNFNTGQNFGYSCCTSNCDSDLYSISFDYVNNFNSQTMLKSFLNWQTNDDLYYEISEMKSSKLENSVSKLEASEDNLTSAVSDLSLKCHQSSMTSNVVKPARPPPPARALKTLRKQELKAPVSAQSKRNPKKFPKLCWLPFVLSFGFLEFLQALLICQSVGLFERPSVVNKNRNVKEISFGVLDRNDVDEFNQTNEDSLAKSILSPSSDLIFRNFLNASLANLSYIDDIELFKKSLLDFFDSERLPKSRQFSRKIDLDKDLDEISNQISNLSNQLTNSLDGGLENGLGTVLAPEIATSLANLTNLVVNATAKVEPRTPTYDVTLKWLPVLVAAACYKLITTFQIGHQLNIIRNDLVFVDKASRKELRFRFPLAVLTHSALLPSLLTFICMPLYVLQFFNFTKTLLYANFACNCACFAGVLCLIVSQVRHRYQRPIRHFGMYQFFAVYSGFLAVLLFLFFTEELVVFRHFL